MLFEVMKQSFGFDIVVAMSENRGIGLNGDIPWHLKGDMAYFRSLTLATHQPQAKNAVIMGRKTWDSLPAAYRPLPQRENIVLTKQQNYSLSTASVYYDFNDALTNLADLQKKQSIDRVFLIGGMQLYQLGINHHLCNRLYITHVKAHFECDCFFPILDTSFKAIHHSKEHTENGLSYQHSIYQREGI